MRRLQSLDNHPKEVLQRQPPTDAERDQRLDGRSEGMPEPIQMEAMELLNDNLA